MNVSDLIPQPNVWETFQRSRVRFVPDVSGCYVLTNFEKVVLYIGLAKNLQRRMNEHLDSLEKTSETPLGRAIFFYWITTDELEKVERTWLNIHTQHEGAFPILNKIYSPTFS